MIDKTKIPNYEYLQKNDVMKILRITRGQLDYIIKKRIIPFTKNGNNEVKVYYKDVLRYMSENESSIEPFKKFIRDKNRITFHVNDTGAYDIPECHYNLIHRLLEERYKDDSNRDEKIQIALQIAYTYYKCAELYDGIENTDSICAKRLEKWYRSYTYIPKMLVDNNILYVQYDYSSGKHPRIYKVCDYDPDTTPYVICCITEDVRSKLLYDEPYKLQSKMQMFAVADEYYSEQIRQYMELTYGQSKIVQTITIADDRIYTNFHGLRKELRKHVQIDDIALTEVGDISSAIYHWAAIYNIIANDDIRQECLNEYEKIKSRRVYNQIQDYYIQKKKIYIHIDDIKKMTMRYFYSNDSCATYIKNVTDEKNVFDAIDLFLKDNLPNMYKLVDLNRGHDKEELNETPLYKELQNIERSIMMKGMSRAFKYRYPDCHFITLHDGIFSECEDISPRIWRETYELTVEVYISDEIQKLKQKEE